MPQRKKKECQLGLSLHFPFPMHFLEANNGVHRDSLHALPPSLFPSSVIISSSLSKAFSKATIFWIAPLLLVNACSSKTPCGEESQCLAEPNIYKTFKKYFKKSWNFRTCENFTSVTHSFYICEKQTGRLRNLPWSL